MLNLRGMYFVESIQINVSPIVALKADKYQLSISILVIGSRRIYNLKKQIDSLISFDREPEASISNTSEH